jgi:hypothetical protein
MHPGGTGFDHRLHQLEGVERAAKPGFGIGNDRRHPVSVVTVTFGLGDLVGAAQCIVDTPDHVGHRVHRIKRLIRIHLPGSIGIGCNLPTR